MEFAKGNIVNAPTEAIVNTVNTVGVMGKGIALQFKERFPNNYYAYKKACKNGEVRIGKMFVFKENSINGNQVIINFPTKTEWYRKSSYNYIEAGLEDLIHVIRKEKIMSVAIPPLGCGNGGLEWYKVKALIKRFVDLIPDVRVIIYQPDENVKQILQKENTKENVKLTPARAMLLYSLFKYEKYGDYATIFTANKLAYFLQASGENLKLNFTPYIYGPYTNAVEKVLYSVNGVYLKGLEELEVKPFEQLDLNYSKFEDLKSYYEKELTSDQIKRVNDLFKLIKGFETGLSLEILASVHYIISQDPNLNINEITEKIHGWTERKKKLIKEEYIIAAFNHLMKFNHQLSFDFS
jgi:O-acetyl-ADP-ribose deacetylase (regulator of RNase III)